MLNKFKLLLLRFRSDEAGVTAIEYGLIAVLIAILIIAGATLTGTSLDAAFKSVASALGSATPAATP